MSHKRRIQLALILFASWIVITSVLLFYLGNRHYGTFASELQWQTTSISLQDLAITAFEPVQLVHVFDEYCACNIRARAHINKLNKNQATAGIGQHFVAPATLQALGFVLPATPAVLVFIDGQLIYAGPYASGVMCAVDDSFIVPILKQDLILPGLWLNSNVTSCRCPLI